MCPIGRRDCPACDIARFEARKTRERFLGWSCRENGEWHASSQGLQSDSQLRSTKLAKISLGPGLLLSGRREISPCVPYQEQYGGPELDISILGQLKAKLLFRKV